MSRKLAASVALAVCATVLTGGVSLADGDGRFGDDTVATCRRCGRCSARRRAPIA